MPAVLSKIQVWIRNVRNFFLKLFNRFLSFVLRKTKSDQNDVIPSMEIQEDSEIAPLLDNEVIDSEITETDASDGAELEQIAGVQLVKPVEVDNPHETAKADDTLQQIVEAVESEREQTVQTGIQLEKPAAANDKFEQNVEAVKSELEKPAEIEDKLEQNAEAVESEREQQTEFFSPMSKTSNDSFQSCEPFESDFDMHTVRTGSRSTMDKESKDAAEDEEDLSDGTWNAEDANESSSSSSSASEGSIHMGEESSDDDAMIDKSEDDEYVGGDGSEDDIATASKENGLTGNKEFVNSSSPSLHASSSSFRD